MISRRFYADCALRVEQARIYERRVLAHSYALIDGRKIFFDKLSFNKLAPTVRVDAETVKPTVKEHFRKYLAFKSRSVIKSLLKALIARLSALAEVTQEIAEHHIGRILYDCVVHIHKCFRLDPIVAVDKADIVTARGRNSRLSCAEQTAVLLMHNLHARVLSRIFVANLGTAVGRAVVDNDYFHIIECLCRKALETLAEIFFNFIYRHYDAYHNFISLKTNRILFLLPMRRRAL